MRVRPLGFLVTLCFLLIVLGAAWLTHGSVLEACGYDEFSPFPVPSSSEGFKDRLAVHSFNLSSSTLLGCVWQHLALSLLLEP